MWQWQIVEVIVVTTDDGSVGYGETLPHYTWGKVSDAALERVRGCNPAALLGDDSLGSGLQMAIYDETRCKLHGGMSTGPRTDAGKAASALGTHGIYAAAMNPEEVEAVTQADDTLANELLVARVQLRRALQSWDTWSAGVPEELPADEYTSTQDDRGKAVTIRRRRPDLWGIIDRCLGRVGRLVEQRARVEEVRDLQVQVQELEVKLEANAA